MLAVWARATEGGSRNLRGFPEEDVELREQLERAEVQRRQQELSGEFLLERLTEGCSHRTTKLKHVKRSVLLVRRQIKEAFWALAKPKSMVATQPLEMVSGQQLQIAPQPETEPVWVLNHVQLGMLLQNLQVPLVDPLRDGAIILQSLDADNSGCVDLFEWCAIFEPVLQKLESADAQYFTQVVKTFPCSSASTPDGKKVQPVLVDLGKVVHATIESVVKWAHEERALVFGAFFSAQSTMLHQLPDDEATEAAIWSTFLLECLYRKPLKGPHVNVTERLQHLLRRLRSIFSRFRPLLQLSSPRLISKVHVGGADYKRCETKDKR